MKKRNIRRWGNSIVIMLTSTDVKDLEIDVDRDEVDIEDIVIIKRSKKK